jgi:hypothetical protein
MRKLRNYCTYYSIPVAAWGLACLGKLEVPSSTSTHSNLTAMNCSAGMSGAQQPRVTSERSRRSSILRPFIERYMAAARSFFQWFWEQVNERSSEIVAELNDKATEVKLWYDEHNLRPDWLFKGDGTPPADWNGRLERAKRRSARYAHGTQGFRVCAVDSQGTVKPSMSDWEPLPR